MKLHCGDQTLDVSQPVVMGILNATADSFSDGGQYFRHGDLDLDLALQRAEAMIREGATIIDVGGESARPGAEPISLEEERRRVIPLVAAIRERFDVVVSVDTSTPEIMREAAAAGAGIINDIRALQRPGALEAAADSGLAVCLMHMQGEPATMQNNPQYDDVTGEVISFLQQRVAACKKVGLSDDKIILDPGFGFGKTLEHNLTLLRDLPRFEELGFPILVGMSRKSMIGHLLGRDVGERLPGSITLAILAAQRGAQIIRVHDVAATVDALKIVTAVEGANPAA